jgi:hypothetical protein
MLSPVHLENNDKPGLRNKVRGLFSSRSPPSPLNVSRSSAPQSSSLINRAKSLRSNTKHSPSLTSSPCSSKSCETSDESFGCVDAIAIQRRQEITGSVEQRQRRIKTRSEPRTDGWREWVPEYACMTCGVRSSDVRRKEDGWYCRTCMFAYLRVHTGMC